MPWRHLSQPRMADDITIDFKSAAMEYRKAHGGGKNQLLAKAIGVKSNYKPTVIDATAGLGRDAYILACLGCEVLMLERNEIIAKKLEQAVADVGMENLKLIQVDAKQYLQSLTPKQFPGVIYIDPMFPLKKKSALVKKVMRDLRAIVGNDKDSHQLLEIALKCAKKRVVVKRHKQSETLNETKPSFSLTGKSSRFDIYLGGENTII